jgi:hypothetical protein
MENILQGLSMIGIVLLILIVLVILIVYPFGIDVNIFKIPYGISVLLILPNCLFIIIRDFINLLRR